MQQEPLGLYETSQTQRSLPAALWYTPKVLLPLEGETRMGGQSLPLYCIQKPPQLKPSSQSSRNHTSSTLCDCNLSRERTCKISGWWLETTERRNQCSRRWLLQYRRVSKALSTQSSCQAVILTRVAVHQEASEEDAASVSRAPGYAPETHSHT